MRAWFWAALCALFVLPVSSIADEVSHFPKREVDAAFAQGRPLTKGAGYEIHASRRDAPGAGEVHADDTDIIYVLTGRATFVTGGQLVAPREVAPHELRGDRIAGGVARDLAAGDVIVVPRGTPHWFAAIEGPVTYYVVKVGDAGGVR